MSGFHVLVCHGVSWELSISRSHSVSHSGSAGGTASLVMVMVLCAPSLSGYHPNRPPRQPPI